MIGSMISSLIIAWILTAFEFDIVVISGVKELFDKDISISGYYLIFAIIGLFIGIVK